MKKKCKDIKEKRGSISTTQTSSKDRSESKPRGDGFHRSKSRSVDNSVKRKKDKKKKKKIADDTSLRSSKSKRSVIDSDADESCTITDFEDSVHDQTSKIKSKDENKKKNTFDSSLRSCKVKRNGIDSSDDDGSCTILTDLENSAKLKTKKEKKKKRHSDDASLQSSKSTIYGADSSDDNNNNNNDSCILLPDFDGFAHDDEAEISPRGRSSEREEAKTMIIRRTRSSDGTARERLVVKRNNLTYSNKSNSDKVRKSLIATDASSNPILNLQETFNGDDGMLARYRNRYNKTASDGNGTSKEDLVMNASKPIGERNVQQCASKKTERDYRPGLGEELGRATALEMTVGKLRTQLEATEDERDAYQNKVRELEEIIKQQESKIKTLENFCTRMIQNKKRNKYNEDNNSERCMVDSAIPNNAPPGTVTTVLAKKIHAGIDLCGDGTEKIQKLNGPNGESNMHKSTADIVHQIYDEAAATMEDYYYDDNDEDERD